MGKEEFELLYNGYWARLYDFFSYHIDDDEVCKGMIQNLFLSIWERKDSLLIHKNMEHYLFRAAKLKVAEFYRNKAIRKANFDQASLNWPQSENTTENFLKQKELSKVLENLVLQMPKKCRAVYQLSREVGLKNNEIAREMAISPKTVENQLTRALNFIRAGLKINADQNDLRNP